MSDWKKSAARRRDVRHGGPISHASAPASKDTKRWCRGKVGVEHQPEPKPYDTVKGMATFPTGLVMAHPEWWLLVCKTCGKELDRYWPLTFALEGGGRTKVKPAPSWVPVRAASDESSTV